MSKNRRIKETSPSTGHDRRREVLGVLGLGVCVFLLVAMVSLQLDRLVMGPFGRTAASSFYGVVGLCGYLVIVASAVAAVRALLVREPVVPLAIGSGVVIGICALAVLVHLAAAGYRVAGHGPGGAGGE